MLVEFRVENFRSLRNEQVLSLVASKDKTLRDENVFETSIKDVPELLRSAVLYGANAAGKSNLIRALQSMHSVIVGSAAMIHGQTLSFSPFRFDAAAEEEPTKFEITFILNDVRYQYGFTMTSQRIVSEYLLLYKSSRARRWFHRFFDRETQKDVYEFGAGLNGPKHMWANATRENGLFLSTATQLNSEDLRPVFAWLANNLLMFDRNRPFGQRATVDKLRTEDGRKELQRFLSDFDLGVVDIDFIEPEGVPPIVTTKDTSHGAQILISMAGIVLDALENGAVLVIDDLDESLHSLVVQRLIGLFHDPLVNRTRAQLIMTSHDTALLANKNLFRRDQIWFVEKDQNSASLLFSLAEFSTKRNESLEKNYLTGLYGGIPFLKNLI